LLVPDFESSHGLLGTPFGGNHLACAAAIAVLDTRSENLIRHEEVAKSFMKELETHARSNRR
jgi:acetylornithine aminotransferase